MSYIVRLIKHDTYIKQNGSSKNDSMSYLLKITFMNNDPI